MFEMTFRGKTMQFETAQEMEEWRQRMMSPIIPRKRPKNSQSKNHTKLADIVKKRK